MLKKNKIVPLVSPLVFSLVFLNLSGCSRLDNFLDAKDRVNYQNNRTVKSLDFPPDLTAPEFDKEFELPSSSANTVSMQEGGINKITSAVPTSFSVGPEINQPSQSSQSSQSSQPSQSATSRVGQLSTLVRQGSNTVLQINDTYSRSLILMDIMLERTNFTVVSRNTAAGFYTVQYNGNEDSKPKGWFSRAKKSMGLSDANKDSVTKGKTYKLNINRQQGGAPLVSFQTEAGKALPEAANIKLLTILNNAFNR